MFLNLTRSLTEVVEALGEALEARDAYTANHGLRVSKYACEIAKNLGLPKRELDILHLGARLHDIGKIGIRDGILLKPGPLTEQEFGLIQTHTLIGPRILSRITGLHPLLPLIELHHENFDGSGYPYGLRGGQTPLIARIIRVADAFDAMTTNRVYRPALTRELALQRIREGTGTLFDPNVVSSVETILGIRHPEVTSANDDDLIEELESLVYATS